MSIMRPAGHKVIVKPDAVEKMSPGGIYLQQDEKLARAMQQWGTLAAVGPDAWKAYRKLDQNGKEVNGQAWAKVGDKVFYSRNAGRQVNHPETDELFVVMNDGDIAIVLEVESE